MEKPTLAITVPCFNEELCVESTVKSLFEVINDLIKKDKIKDDSFVYLIDDGSKDRTWELICKMHRENPLVKGLKFVRNYGNQKAHIAGLLGVRDLGCDCCVSIDADLQDDIDVFDEMIEKYNSGCDIVYGVRNSRKTDTFFKRTTAQAFYRFMSLMGVKTVYNHADFRLMSQRAVKHFSEFKEKNLFLRGIVPLIGYKTDCVYYERKARVAGVSKYPLRKMIALAVEGITSFSIKPISLVTTAGGVILFLSFLAFVYVLVSYIFWHVEPGWSSLMLSIWFLGGVQLLSIGLIGQYIGKIYVEVKQRPRYNIETFLGNSEKKDKEEK